jgi:hypothetical protein
MDGNTSMVIGAVVGIVGIVIGILGWRRTARKDDKDEGAAQGAIMGELTYIRRRSDDTLLEVRDMKACISNHSDRITRVEESCKSAHHRIDGLTNKQ